LMKPVAIDTERSPAGQMSCSVQIPKGWPYCLQPFWSQVYILQELFI
jgi:hypothetical protein